MTDFERRLRSELREQARRAPDGRALAERIIAQTAGHADIAPRRRRRWQAWAYPLVAASAVAVAALAVVGYGNDGGTPHRAAADTHLATATEQEPTPPPATPSASASASATRILNVQSAGGTSLLTNVRVHDLTFVGPDDGWALGTADCLDAAPDATDAPVQTTATTATGATSAPVRTCTAMLRTTDAGTRWRGMVTPPANVPGASAGSDAGTDPSACAAPCIKHIRFATERIGYAFGPSALFMTTDGGGSWMQLRGGADALETLDGNVIRVVHPGSACPPGCHYSVRIAAIGKAEWRSVALPAANRIPTAAGVALTRTGSTAYLEIFGHPSGGAPGAGSTLYTSENDGASWIRRGEPCPQRGGEVDSSRLASAPDGSVSVLCTPRGGRGDRFTATSTDGGRTFRAAPVSLGSAGVSAFAAASATTLLVSSDSTYRSVDGGQHWARPAAGAGSGPGPLSWLGFESDTLGRAVSPDGATIWTTRDAGATWSAYAFG